MIKRILIIWLLALSLVYAQMSENPFGSLSKSETEQSVKRPSKWTAAGLSLLVPGLGQYYLGKNNSAALFMGVEGTIWATYAGFQIYGGWRKREYQNWSALYAGVDTDEKDEQFYQDVLNYSSRDNYNYWNHLIYRDTTPLYPESDEYYWNWQSQDKWDVYADIWESSETAYRNSRTVLGVALINRVISIVDVFRTDLSQLESVNGVGEGVSVMPRAIMRTSPDGEVAVGVAFTTAF